MRRRVLEEEAARSSCVMGPLLILMNSCQVNNQVGLLNEYDVPVFTVPDACGASISRDVHHYVHLYKMKA